MLIVTTDGLAGHEIRGVLGEVMGVAVQTDQARASAGGASGTFPVTGERPGAGLAALRRQAVERLGEEARRKGANAVVGMRLDSVPLAAGGHEVCAYGTAVWAEAAAGAPRDQAAAPRSQAVPQMPPYGDPQPGGPPVAARNLTIGVHERPR
ncbi:hypothetical protein Arub01_11270 [Actinomadura rubrobrunea]|uniref:YbjQ family protein n=1 Tax=Actinomadura rubrobrunea TaxID=115335 RepID=A0A9W6UUI2_9ACTN|nr:heavy metal-binding domain-containing protein [Actinomadura rubrobrunea]GLW62883.1 hypothetical protein Arub01_11270 [Actinomadura rubrobrunea]